MDKSEKKVNWNLLDEVLKMQKNFKLDAHEVASTNQQGERTNFYITDGCNGFFKIMTNHDEVYVNKEALKLAMKYIEEETSNA